MVRSFRRVVTGHNSEGKSIIWKDSSAPNIVEPLPQFALHEMWETKSPADNTTEDEVATRENSIEPHYFSEKILNCLAGKTIPIKKQHVQHILKQHLWNKANTY